jgi:hypothetical protein
MFNVQQSILIRSACLYLRCPSPKLQTDHPSAVEPSGTQWEFFTVSTLQLKVLFVFVVVAHKRRRVLHFNIAEHPTAEWTAQQIIEAFPEDTTAVSDAGS